MGKAEIIEHIGSGQYRIKLLRDRTWLDGRVAWAEGRIATLQSERVPLADDVDAKHADLNTLLAEINDLVSQSPIDRDAVRIKNIEAIRAREALSQARVVLARHDAELHSIEKRLAGWQAIVNNLEADERDVWCADLSTTLAGEHPTLEVNGTSDHALLMPGTMPNEYTGDLVPTLSMTPAQAAFNFAIHPGWQRWTPTFRIATITALNAAQDTCSVVLATAKDRYQGLQINEDETLDNVPISYMTCNAEAFAVGDEVLVMFQGQSWESPVVIGFKQEPKTCDAQLIVIVSSQSGSEAFAWDLLNNEFVAAGTLAAVQASVGAGTALVPSGEHAVESTLVAGNTYNPGYDMPLFGSIAASGDWAGSWLISIKTSGQSGFANFGYPYIQNPDDPEETTGAYYVHLYNGLQSKAAFQAHTGIVCDPEMATDADNFTTWNDRPHIDRQRLYHRGLWGVSWADVTGHPNNLDAYLMHKPYDAWDDVSIPCYDRGHVVPGLTDPDPGGVTYTVLNRTQQIPYSPWTTVQLDGATDVQYSGPIPHYSAFWTDMGIASIGNDHLVMEQNIIIGDFFSSDTGLPFANPSNIKRDFRLFVKQDNPLTGLALEIWNEINAVKASSSQPEVVFNRALYEAAKRHADDFATNDVKYWECPDGAGCHVPGTGMPDASHVGTDGSLIADRVYGANYNQYVRYWDAEYNPVGSPALAAASDTYLYAIEIVNALNPGQTAEQCVQEWMDSVYDHADAILNNLGLTYPADEAGLAVTESAGGTIYVVCVFGYRARMWPGFAARNTDSMVAYMDTNFTWPEVEDKTRLPKIYLT